MFRFSLSVTALALAASGAIAQNNGQAEPEQAARPIAEERGAALRESGSPAPRVDLRPLREIDPEAQRVVRDILSNEDRLEAARAAAPAADRPEPPMRSGARPAARSATERVLERMVSGPLDRSVRLLADCPRGLAKIGGCEAPGQARSARGQRNSTLGTVYSPALFGLTGFDAGRYLYRDGYLMQLVGDPANGGGIAGYIPLLGGALASGNIWPGSYGSQRVPAYLVDFYNLGEPGSYRYADNTLFRVDHRSGVIHSIAALLTDEDIAIGEPMPAGYDVYNVPFPYRDRYADSDAAAYRYVDGYVYRVDPETRLVTEAIDLLT